jgi:hypothetical protein
MTTDVTLPRKGSKPSKPTLSQSYAEPTRSSHCTFGASYSHKLNTPSISSAQLASAPLCRHTPTFGVPTITTPIHLRPSAARLRLTFIRESARPGRHTQQAATTLATCMSITDATKSTSLQRRATEFATRYISNTHDADDYPGCLFTPRRRQVDAIGGIIPKTTVTEDAITQLIAIFHEKAMVILDVTSAQRCSARSQQ